MKLENQFIPYKAALELKELGFEEPCLGVWNNPIGDTYIVTLVYSGVLHEGYINEAGSLKVMSPLWQESFDWFSEKYGFYGIVVPVSVDEAVLNKWDYYIIDMQDKIEEEYDTLPYHTLLEAKEALLNKLIELAKNR